MVLAIDLPCLTVQPFDSRSELPQSQQLSRGLQICGYRAACLVVEMNICPEANAKTSQAYTQILCLLILAKR